jgi:3-dehydroquinate synthase
MRRLNVELAARSYPILIGRGLLARADLLLDHLRTPRVALVSNVTVAPLYAAAFAEALAELGGCRHADHPAGWGSVQELGIAQPDP